MNLYMPHLSPLNWIIIIILILLTVSLINALIWWKPKSKFLYNKKNITTYIKIWSWL